MLIPCPPIPEGSSTFCTSDWGFISLFSFLRYFVEIAFYTEDNVVWMPEIRFILELLLYLFVTYLLSCLIVWIYKKYKKRIRFK